MIEITCYLCNGGNYEPAAGDKLNPVNNSSTDLACDVCLHGEHMSCEGCDNQFNSDYLQKEYNNIGLDGHYCDDCAPSAAQEIQDNIKGNNDLISWYYSQCI